MKNLLYFFILVFTISNTSIFSQIFIDNDSNSFLGVSDISQWGDYDNDGDLDIFCLGSTENGSKFLIYKNEGYGIFALQDLPNLIGLDNGSDFDLGDYNNDSFIDILATGYDGSSNVTKIYKNINGVNFEAQSSINLQGASFGSVNWGDYDLDGDLDILFVGHNFTAIYTNNNNTSFVKEYHLFDMLVQYGSASWADYNNDKYLDVLITGYNGAITSTTLLKNINGENFVKVNTPIYKGFEQATSAWGDYDNDGDLDLLITGHSIPTGRISKIYRNDGNDNFTDLTNISIVGTLNGSAMWGDYNNDGKLDFVISGSSDTGNVTYLYKNDGNNQFSVQDTIKLLGVKDGSVQFGDYDNDNDLDLLLSGNVDNSSVTKLYENKSTKSNSRPSAPQNLAYSIENGTVSFSWNKSNDTESGSDGISYNIDIIGTKKLSSMADTKTGFRRIIKIGNTGLNNFHQIDLPPGDYGWQVQAIDQSFGYSSFSEINSFFVPSGTIAVVKPNGGEIWEVGSLQEIKWYSAGLSNPVILLYSIDGGNSWIDFWGAQTTSDNSYIWEVPNIPSNNCLIKVKASVDSSIFDISNSSFSIELSTGIENEKKIIKDYSLEQNYPNPFNPTTTINYTLPDAAINNSFPVQLVVYDILGNEMALLVNENQSSGEHQITFNANRLANGVYYYQLKAGDLIQTKKMILLK